MQLNRVNSKSAVKSVASAIPVYSMSYLRFPKNITEDLDRNFHDFWWGDKVDEKTVHTIKWNDIC